MSGQSGGQESLAVVETGIGPVLRFEDFRTKCTRGQYWFALFVFIS
tara:strand:- start:867 stop:1004 length:138 start_codon:yes stop_codon:yes gene_type:complete